MRLTLLLGISLLAGCLLGAPFPVDEDEDGFIATDCGWYEDCDQKWDEDCDDSDPNVNPDAEEICDGIDNDCNGDVDFGCDTADTGG